MIKVLFVCHGNICRSPMAEYIMKDMAAKAGITHKLEISSVATSREELGNPIYPPAQAELRKRGVPFGYHAARQITAADCTYYNRIYYMDSRNYTYLSRMFPGETKFQPFLNRDVADPWYSGDFTATWRDLEEGCSRILQEVIHG